MKVGIIGLGKMGMSIALRGLAGGHEIVGYDPHQEARGQLEQHGAVVVHALEDLPLHVRVFWLMVPAGKEVDNVLEALLPGLREGDIVIDGGNSHFKDSVRRSQMLSAKGIHFLDCGVSGGLKGREIGFALMVGGSADIAKNMESFFLSLAAPQGYAHVGPSGAGHYVKMVHNGIEYALLQAYAEGFHLLHEGRYKDLDLAQVAHVWSHGSVVRSWIVELCAEIFDNDQKLDAISGAIAENLTGRWTVDEAGEQNIPVRLIQDALDIRAWSRQTGGNYSTKVVALLRHAFGGHEVKKEKV